MTSHGLDVAGLKDSSSGNTFKWRHNEHKKTDFNVCSTSASIKHDNQNQRLVVKSSSNVTTGTVSATEPAHTNIQAESDVNIATICNGSGIVVSDGNGGATVINISEDEAKAIFDLINPY